MEVTASPGVAFLPYSYGWLIGLGTSFGMLEGTASGDVPLSPSVILVCRGHRVVLGSISWQSGFPLFVLGHFFLLGMDLELDMKWAGVPRSFDHTVTKSD